MLCVKARLPTKQNADSQKTTCFKCFTETPCFTHTSRNIMFLLRPSILAAAMLSCTHLHFISSYVLSLLYMFEMPKSFQLRPWPQICTPILTAAMLYCMHLHFISPMSCLCFEGLRNPNSSGHGGQRNTPKAVKQWLCLPPKWHSGIDIHIHENHKNSLIEGSLEVKLPTIWTDEKQSWAEAERREE